MKNTNQNHNLECLVIDWKFDKIKKLDEILEKMGYEDKSESKFRNIKEEIQRVLENHKRGREISTTEMNGVRSSLLHCDHHDLVRVDSIITRIWNETDMEYQWGSVVKNLKWKI